uniref:Uncharacterized protein n=1 Tax=Physcomitrium patens TaxID=3218 RepID=A0A2K1JBD9_PHYPA|nr:hypothetical protein PHYPA_019130 [Physcomitrium patens]
MSCEALPGCGDPLVGALENSRVRRAHNMRMHGQPGAIPANHAEGHNPFFLPSSVAQMPVTPPTTKHVRIITLTPHLFPSNPNNTIQLLAHTLSLSLSLSLALTHTHIHTHSLTRSLTHSYTKEYRPSQPSENT